MSICKREGCGAEITWKQENGRNVPYNLDGTKHQCPPRPQQQGGTPSAPCTSPKGSPAAADGPTTIEGEIAALDLEAKKLQILTPDNNFTPLSWTNCPDISRQKVGYYNKFTIQDGLIIAITKAERPAGFKGANRGGRGGRPYQPRNEKLIVAQCLVKAYTDLYIASNPPDGLDFDAGRTAILEAVENDIDRVMKAGGA